MISEISKALEKGFSEDQILEFIVKKFPKFASKISGAKFAGFNASQILNTLLGDKIGRENARPPTTEYEETRTKDIQSQENRGRIAKTGLALGAASLAAPTALGALQRALPSTLQTLAPSLLSSNIGQDQPLETTEIPQQPPSLGNASLPQQTQPAQPKGFDTNIIKNGLAYRRQIDALIKSGNGPEEIEAYLKKFNPSFIKTIEKEGKGPFKDVVSQYMQEKLRDEAMQPEGSIPNAKTAPQQSQISQSVESQSQELDVPKETPKIEKKAIVSTPNGVGEVKEIRNGQAIIDVDGKLHKVKEEELEAEPEEIRDLDLEGPVSEYLSRIPEAQKSSVIDVSLYDPSTQELQIRFPNGDQWVYSDIPEEIFDKINSMTGIPVSSGESKLRGTIWDSGVANSAGADFYKLIKKLVREGKIKERKLKTGIDLFKGFTSVKKRK